MHIFGDDEAVIQMIIKGRSPTMRHVSRPHRVALDLLFHRIHLHLKMKIVLRMLRELLSMLEDSREDIDHF